MESWKMANGGSKRIKRCINNTKCKKIVKRGNMVAFTALFGVLKNKWVIISAAILFVLISAFAYYQYTSRTIENLRNENAQLKEDNAQLQENIVQLKKDFSAIITAKDKLAAEKEELEKKSKELEDTLFRERKGKKPLEELALKKPSLVEKKINEATQNTFECIEKISAGGKC